MFGGTRRLWLATVAFAAVALGVAVTMLWSGRSRVLQQRHAVGTSGPLNVVLITADTIGADMLGCYGNRDTETPRLDGLAKAGIVYENATTTAPLTLPAHTSIMTGAYPMSHGVRDNVGFYVRPNQVTLASILKHAGYATGAFVGAFVLDGRWGLGLGFDRYADDFDASDAAVVSPDSVRHQGEVVLGKALTWVGGVKQKPFFAWIHFYDAHAPYAPPEPYRTRYGHEKWGLYRGQVAHVDALVGQVLDWLDRNGLKDRTVVAFVGDHGESLGRHGEDSHGVLVYDATLHVPMIVRAPGDALSGRFESEVRTIDLLPTLLDLLGISVPASVEGQSLLGPTRNRVAYSESFNAKHEYGWSELRSLHTDSYHFIEAPRPELYDVHRDPEELNDLAAAKPDLLHGFERELDELVARDHADDDPLRSIDDASRRRLASLGYTDGGRSGPSGPRPVNPIDRIGSVNLLKQAEADLVGGRLDAAGEKAARVTASDPDAVAAYNILGNVALKKGEPRRALDSYQQALARNPEYRAALFNIAVAYYALKKPDAAVAAWQHLVRLDPRDIDARLRLAQLAAQAGDAPRASSLFQQLLSEQPQSAEAAEGLGTLALSRGDLQSAETYLTRAATINPALLDVHYDLGVVLHGRSDYAGAEREYRLEIAAHPDNVKAYHYLGLLYAQMNNFDGQLEAFQAVVRLDPSVAQAHFLLADALFEKQQLAAALDHVQRAIALDPNQQQPYLLLAAIEDKLGHTSERERALEIARSKAPQAGR